MNILTLHVIYEDNITIILHLAHYAHTTPVQEQVEVEHLARSTLFFMKKKKPKEVIE